MCVASYVVAIAVHDPLPSFTGMVDSTTHKGNMLNLTLSWGEPFNNCDPTISYSVTCFGGINVLIIKQSSANTTRSYNIANLNSTAIYNFAVFATILLVMEESQQYIYMITLLSGAYVP